MIRIGIKGVQKAVYWIGTPHPIKEYLWPVVAVPTLTLLSVLEGLDVAFDKSKSNRSKMFLSNLLMKCSVIKCQYIFDNPNAKILSSDVSICFLDKKSISKSAYLIFLNAFSISPVISVFGEDF